MDHFDPEIDDDPRWQHHVDGFCSDCGEPCTSISEEVEEDFWCNPRGELVEVSPCCGAEMVAELEDDEVPCSVCGDLVTEYRYAVEPDGTTKYVCDSCDEEEEQ